MTRPARPATVAAVAVVAGCLSACGFDNARYRVDQLPTRPPGTLSVSIVGAYRNGRMDGSWWERLAPSLAPQFGGQCALGFDDHLRAVDRPLYEKIDSESKDEGLTPEILGGLAPRAEGEYLFTLTVFGKVPGTAHGKPKRPVTPAASPGGMTNVGGRRRQPMGPSGPRRNTLQEDLDEMDTFEITGSLLTAATRQPVASLSMRYSGSDIDEAYAKFAARLRATLGETRCAGWK